MKLCRTNSYVDETGVVAKHLIFVEAVMNSIKRQIKGNLVAWYKSMFAVFLIFYLFSKI